MNRNFSHKYILLSNTQYIMIKSIYAYYLSTYIIYYNYYYYKESILWRLIWKRRVCTYSALNVSFFKPWLKIIINVYHEFSYSLLLLSLLLLLNVSHCVGSCYKNVINFMIANIYVCVVFCFFLNTAFFRERNVRIRKYNIYIYIIAIV